MKAKLVLISALFLGLTGCEDMGGTTSVAEAFNVFVNNKRHTIAKGVYNTTLNFKRDKVEVTLNGNNTKTKIKFQYAPGTRLPSNGPFELRSEQTGQPVDVFGEIQTTETRSERRRGVESCQYQDVDVVCGPHGCSSVPVNRWGQQVIEYYLRTVNRVVKFNIVEVNASSNRLAKFNGESEYSEKVILYQDRCR